MAIDNLNYYSSWLPAWQQTDKYSNLPWCLKSKNLDIFSSSKSVKATAFSQPSQWANDIIKQEWKLKLKTDGKVYEEINGVDVLLNDPSVNFPVYQVCYTWKNWTYENAQWGTPQDMSVRYEWDEWRSYVVFTDRAMLVYTKTAFIFDKELSTSSFTMDSWDPWQDWYWFTRDNFGGNWYIFIKVTNPRIWIMPLNIYCIEPDTTDVTAYLSDVSVDFGVTKFYYDAQVDGMVSSWQSSYVNIPFTWTIQEGIHLDIPISDAYDGEYVRVSLNFNRTRRAWKSWDSWTWGKIYIDINWWPKEDHRMIIDWVKSEWDYKEKYGYLPVRERELVSVWNYAYSQSYWMKWVSFQPLYKWNGTWVDDNWAKKILYDFINDMWWENDPAMDVIWMIIWNEQVYMIGNLNWDWYIIPCDLTGGIGTPYVAYWCTFKWATNIDYLMYLVWDDRGISCLWAYNWQELVQLIGGNKESNVSDMIDNDEQYKFDWGIVNWRKNLILSTSDNRLFQYWQTYGGKWWTFIHELPSNAANVTLKANGKDLEVSYTITASWTTTKYITKYQDDVAVKNYNTEWMAVYPMVIGNHLLEKEESDLYVSYIIPSNLTKLEFWAGANHYHFWTFKMTPWTQAPAVWSTWEIEWIGNPRDLPHMLTNLDQVSFVEANGDYFTFRGVWELPVLSGNETWRLKRGWIKDIPTYLNFTEVHHFRKIWEITAWWFTEWEFRFTNLNNKLELPKSHTLQIMVKWIGTNQFTPELFSLDLVANQRDRW